MQYAYQNKHCRNFPTSNFTQLLLLISLISKGIYFQGMITTVIIVILVLMSLQICNYSNNKRSRIQEYKLIGYIKFKEP